MEKERNTLQVEPVQPARSGLSKKAKVLIGVFIAVILLMLAATSLPIYLRSMEKKASSVPQQAISAIRKVYDVYRAENGSLEGLTPEDAVEEADLSEETRTKWDFDVVLKSDEDFRRGVEYNRIHPDEGLFGMSPFKYIIATSKKANRKGDYKQVWYNPDHAKFHGYGVDQFTDPEADFEYLESVEVDAGSGDARIASPLSRYRDKSISSEAQTAIAAIRKTYDIYRQTNGTTENFTIDRALRETNLGESTLLNWSFSVRDNPPRYFIAESTSRSEAGAGKTVWYDVDDAKFHGYGVDQLTSP